MWCNLLPPPRPDSVNKNSDTLSEVSETGTATSGWNSNWDSREDLKDFVTKIGLKDVADLYQDRFRVDRKKLEQMLTGDNDALIPADVFFTKIMEDTDTFITWPNKLKIGAKSKKDPHVRIAGRPDDVQAAKERIMSILDTRCNRVTMKMDVSYTDHSHIIGKGGRSIKRVMEETQCHVHFPDSNRSNPTEKSNQVSISGDIEGIECARSRVRELIPLIFGFELPIMAQNMDANNPYVIKIQDQYHVQVMFKTRPKLHAILVLVKGVEWEVDEVKHATLRLMEFMCENLANQIPVQMSMEISPHHHQIVLGKNHSNLKAIMQLTSCQIMFPDAQDPNIPSLKKSNVTITGNIHNVYRARQLLMGSLPLIIIFDLPEDGACAGVKVRPDQINEIQQTCDVVINIRQKAKQNTKACVIKGVERHAVNIYKARNMVLGIDDPPICADIPATYHMPKPTPTSPFSPTSSDLTPTPTNATNINPMSPLLSPLVASNWQYPPTGNASSSTFLGMLPQTQPQQQAPPPHQHREHRGQFSSGVAANLSGSSGYGTLGGMGSSLEASRENSYSSSASPRRSLSPCYRNFTEAPSTSAAPDKMELSTVLSEMTLSYGRRSYEAMGGDLETRRLAGLRAMQSRPTSASYRVPTSIWSGYGISHTSPGVIPPSAINGGGATADKDDDIWQSPPPQMQQPPKSADLYGGFSSPAAGTAMPSSDTSIFNTSNLLDHTPTHIINRVTSSNWTDLPSMLTSLGLERYIGLFTNHEIDLSTFATFNDQDLIEIGINAFGARRKLLLAVSELNKRMRPFLMAPGAERKNSSSTNSTLSPRENW